MSKKYLSSLYVYPVKSFKGMSLDEVEVGPKGPSMDRRWMVVDSSNRFLSQRKLPKMAMVHTYLDGRYLFLSAPSMMPLMLPSKPVGKECEVVVWKDTCKAHDMGDEAARWISEFLGVDCRLVFLPDESRRTVNPNYAPSPDNQVAFSDGFPFLLISEASLQDLNQRVGENLRMNRFRPNLVISNCEPYEEDRWKKIRIGEIVFHVAKPCSRCIVTQVDQEYAKPHLDPLQTLATFRKSEQGILFGQNLVHQGTGILRLHSEVEILE